MKYNSYVCYKSINAKLMGLLRNIGHYYKLSMMRKLLLSVTLLILCTATGLAQYKFSGTLFTEDDEPIAEGIISLSKNDELIAMAMANDKGVFSIENIPSGEFLLEINALGFENYVQTFTFDGDKVDLKFILKKSSETLLDELVVVGERSKQTATGEIYYLSQKAKKSRNPFKALSEIPSLRVNIATQRITTLDGIAPMILVDGKPINTGINPINPEDIESVELINVVSARYLQKGYQNVLNVKLKRKRSPYQFYEVASRSDILPGHGFGVGYFEVGNPKISLFGRLSFNGTLNRKSDFKQWQDNSQIHKSIDGSQTANDRGIDGDLILKWQISPRDYMAAMISGKQENSRTEIKGDGIFRQISTALETPFTLTSLGRNKSKIITSSLYYQHDFKDKSQLQARYGYNFNTNHMDNKRLEEDNTSPSPFESLFEYANKRSSMNMEVNYLKQWENGSSLDVGSNSRWINDQIDQISEKLPIFKHRRFDEYIYASYASKIGSLQYMLSAGLEAIWLMAGDERNRYAKPRISISTNYSFDKKNSVRVSYQLTNTPPNVGQLNPYNTSVDPLVATKGNPKLTPEQSHSLALNYRLRVGRFILNPIQVNYSHYIDRILPYSELTEGKVLHSFRNQGKDDFLNYGASLSYLFKDGMSYYYLNAGQNRVYFENQKVKTTPLLSAGVWWFKGKWVVGADISWQKYSFTPQSTTQYLSPTFAQMQVNYNFTPDFYIALAVQNFAGAMTEETYSEAGKFKSFHWNKQTHLGFRPWILIRYTIRKHTKQKIRIGNVLHSQEEGIKL